MTALLAGLLLGVVGSGHCAAMCGPLVLAAGPPVDRTRPASSGLRLLVYHLGRIATYLVLALSAGFVGQVVSWTGFERAAAVAAASVLAATAFGVGQTSGMARAARSWSAGAARTCARALPLGRHRPWAGAFAMGMANGLLPCGMIYAAAAASVGAGSMPSAMLTMLGFGLGTVPALVVVSAAAASFAVSVRVRLARLAPFVLLVAAVLILVRAFDAPEAGSHHV
jgi:sulfite exporter TauE/SafE